MITCTITVKEHAGGVATEMHADNSTGTKPEKWVAALLDSGLRATLINIGQCSKRGELIEGQNIEKAVTAFLKRKEQEAASE